MAVRFDIGDLKLRSPYRTHDGMLVCDATFARDGVLEYRLPNGQVRRELRLPEENRQALTKFGLVPVTIEHPPVLVTEDNAEQYRKGISLGDVQYGKGGFVSGVVTLMDSDAIEYATSKGGAEISAGYTCDIEESSGVWNGARYDAIQRNITVNHLAITKKGRAGPEVRLHLDSEEDVAYQVSSTSKPRMATLRIDSIDYEIPESLAPLLGPKIRRLDELEAEVGDYKDKVSELTESLQEAIRERDHYNGRADGYEVILGSAEAVLEELGYVRDSVGDYVRVDKKKGMMPHENDMSEDESEGDDADMEEDMSEEPKGHKHGKKKADGGYKKMDSEVQPVADVRMDAKALMVAWKEADQLTGKPISDEHFDSADSPADIRRLVVATLRPTMKDRLDSMSDAAVEGIYDFLKEEQSSKTEPAEEPRTDSRQSYSSELQAVLGAAKASTPAPGATGEVSNAYTQPLSLSLSR